MPGSSIQSRIAAPGMTWVVRMLAAARVLFAGAWLAFLAGPLLPLFGVVAFPYRQLGCITLAGIFFFWFLVVLLEWEIKQRRLARLEHGYCPDCGHDLIHTPDQCPQCRRVTSNIAVAITHTGQIPAGDQFASASDTPGPTVPPPAR